MIKLDFRVDKISKISEESGEFGFAEHPRDSRRKGENPVVGFKRQKTGSQKYIILRGTLGSASEAEVRINPYLLHPEWNGRINQKKFEAFREEMIDLIGETIYVERNLQYEPDYEDLRKKI